MKARPRPLGLCGEVALLHRHPNGTRRLNMQICVYADSLVIYLSWNNQLQNDLSLFILHQHFPISGISSNHNTSLHPNLRGALSFLFKACALLQLACYPIITINILLRSNYSSCSNTFSLPLWNPELHLFFFFFFILRPVTYNHLENIAGQWISLSRNY